MSESYIVHYERNLIQEAVNEAVDDVKRDIALKMKADGVSSDFIFKYCGVRYRASNLF